jgi:succinate dehydrogenase / fumarate reductase flavoprotein subunit
MEMRRYIHSIGFPKLPADPEKKAVDDIRKLMEGTGAERTGPVMTAMQETMMENVSVFRDKKGLNATLQKIADLKERYKGISVQDKGNCFNRDLLEALELGYMLDLAEAITLGALRREESRGSHYREDFQKRNDEKYLKHTMVRYAEKEPEIFYKPVSITKFQPKERTY